MTEVAPPAAVPVIEIDRLSKTYASKNGEVTALQDVALSAAAGEFVSIVGPSGCGKSTLLKIVLGVVPSSAGAARLNGRTIAGPQTGIGMVFQAPALPPWRRVIDNVLLPIEVMGKDRGQYVERARALLQMVGLADFTRMWPRELSGGMQQRVSICRALIHEPALLLLDEPFGALDALTRETMQEQLLDIVRRSAITVLLVTHSVEEAILLSDRVIVMSPRPGRVVREIGIDLPGRRDARTRSTPEFQAYALTLRRELGLDGGHSNEGDKNGR